MYFPRCTVAILERVGFKGVYKWASLFSLVRDEFRFTKMKLLRRLRTKLLKINRINGEVKFQTNWESDILKNDNGAFPFMKLKRASNRNVY